MFSVNHFVVFFALFLGLASWNAKEVAAQFGDFVEQEIYDPPPSRYDSLGGYWHNSPFTREQIAKLMSQQFLQKHLPTKKQATSSKHVLQRIMDNMKQNNKS